MSRELLRGRLSRLWPWVDRAFWLLPLLGLLYAGAPLALNLHRGFDITDESYYLLSARSPEDVLASATQFGHYTGVLYWTASHDLAAFRGLGLALLLVAAAGLGLSLDRYWRSIGGSSPSSAVTVTLTLATSLGYYATWLVTPSYNWMALTCTLLVATGLLAGAALARAGTPGPAAGRWMAAWGGLVGIGGGLAFLAKPTTAAALAIVAALWIVATDLRGRWKVLTLASTGCATMVILAHAIVVEGGVADASTQIRGGLELSRILGGGHTLGQVLQQASSDLVGIPRLMWTSALSRKTGLGLAALVAAMVFVRRRAWPRRRAQPALAIGFAGLFVLATYELWRLGAWQIDGSAVGPTALTFSLLVGLCVLILAARDRGEHAVRPRDLASLYALLIASAMAFALGSNNGLIAQMGGAYVLVAMASFVGASWMSQRLDSRLVGSTVALAHVVIVSALSSSARARPYRQLGPVAGQDNPVTFLGSDSEVYVDERTARYVDGLKASAAGAGWRSGTWLIDLTGATPGAVVILDGRAPATPWLFGGYPGSDAFATAALEMSPTTDLAAAWVLTAPTGGQSLSPRVLVDVGLDFPNAYETVGHVTTGYRDEAQLLWRPRTGLPADASK